jgi:mRNA deadenylase 3'-5' endonuclease subunit Ccr4
LEWLDGDILCLQEVDPSYFEDLLYQKLSKLGYEGNFALQSDKEGIASFFKTEVFELVMKKEISINDMMQEGCRENGQEALISHLKICNKVLMMALRHKSSNQLLIIGKKVDNEYFIYEYMWFEICF